MRFLAHYLTVLELSSEIIIVIAVDDAVFVFVVLFIIIIIVLYMWQRHQLIMFCTVRQQHLNIYIRELSVSWKNSFASEQQSQNILQHNSSASYLLNNEWRAISSCKNLLHKLLLQDLTKVLIVNEHQSKSDWSHCSWSLLTQQKLESIVLLTHFKKSLLSAIIERFVNNSVSLFDVSRIAELLMKNFFRLTFMKSIKQNI